MKPTMSRRKKIVLIALGAVLGLLALLAALAVLFINSKMSLLDRSASYGAGSLSPDEEELSFDHLDLDYIDVYKRQSRGCTPGRLVFLGAAALGRLLPCPVHLPK